MNHSLPQKKVDYPKPVNRRQATVSRGTVMSNCEDSEVINEK